MAISSKYSCYTALSVCSELKSLELRRTNKADEVFHQLLVVIKCLPKYR